MRAQHLRDLLKRGDRVAVSNVTGREAAKVTFASQLFCENIVGGWALGKGGQKISVPKGRRYRSTMLSVETWYLSLRQSTNRYSHQPPITASKAVPMIIAVSVEKSFSVPVMLSPVKTRTRIAHKIGSQVFLNSNHQCLR